MFWLFKISFQHLCPVQCNKSRGSKVCASDGKTYNNECAVFQKQCEGENVFFEHFGSCCENDDCSGYEGEEMLMDALEFEENENEEGKNLTLTDKMTNILSTLISLKMAERSEAKNCEAKLCLRIFLILIFVVKSRFALLASLHSAIFSEIKNNKKLVILPAKVKKKYCVKKMKKKFVDFKLSCRNLFWIVLKLFYFVFV